MPHLTVLTRTLPTPMEERHDAILEYLVHSAFVAVHGVHHDVQRRVEERAGLLRIEAGILSAR